MRKLRGYRNLACAAAALLIAGAGTAVADTVYVDKNDDDCRGESPCFETIQAAVADPDGPDKIVVFPGVYAESVNLSLWKGDGELMLTHAEDERRPVIEPPPGAHPSPEGRAFYTTSGPSFDGDITIRGFVVTSSTRDAINFDKVDGDVTFENVEAKYARYDGIDVEATGKITCWHSEASDNGDDGFQFFSSKAIRIDHCRADRNGNKDVSIPDPESEGFDLKLTAGYVKIEDAVANNNIGDGIDIEPLEPNGTIDEIEIYRTRTHRNTNIGIVIASDQDAARRIGDVEIAHSTSSDNGSEGIDVEADGEVVMSHIVTNNSSGRSGQGIGIGTLTGPETHRPSRVELTHIVSSGNRSDGIDIEAKGDVTVRHCVTNRNGSGRFAPGVEISTAVGIDAEVIVEDCEANDNSGSGIDIESLAGSAIVHRVTTINNGFGRNRAATTTRKNGILVRTGSGGAISIANCIANRNGDDGIDAETGGTVEIENCEASHNGEPGDDVANGLPPTDDDSGQGNGIKVKAVHPGAFDGTPTDTTAPDAILIREVVVDGNADDGIDVVSESEVELRRVCAEGNLEDGIFVQGTGDKLRVKFAELRGNLDTGLFLDGLGDTDNDVRKSNIVGNTRGLLLNNDPGDTVEAERNWWGSPLGPMGDGLVINAGSVDITPVAKVPVDIDSVLVAASDDGLAVPFHDCEKLRGKKRGRK